MSADENMALYRRWIDEVLNTGDASRIDEFVAADAVDHSLPPGMPPTCEGSRQAVGLYAGAFPDMHVTIEDLTAEGDRVWAHGWMQGTHTGSLMGIPASGRPINVEYMDIMRIENGMLAEHWLVLDQMGMLQQMGVMPPLGEPPPG